jgi:hypothetical protein
MVARRTYIVEEGPNPSTDYFVLPALQNEPNPVIRCTWDQLPSAQDLSFSSVIFVRYFCALRAHSLEATHRPGQI